MAVDFPSGVTDTTPTGLVGFNANATEAAKVACSPAGLVTINRGAPLSVAFASTITLNAAAHDDFSIAPLTGNATLAFTGLSAGQRGVIMVPQDSTGSRTLAPPSGAKTPGGSGILLTNAPSSLDTVSYYYDGTTLYIGTGPHNWA